MSAAAAALLAASCASPRALRSDLDRLATSGQYEEAASRLESSQSRYGQKNILLFHMDRAMLLHLAGRYAESQRAFEAAKQAAADLFTKSVTAEASTFLVSDNMRPYAGEDFERALIHVFAALNYVFLGQEDEALVEARQLDFLLTKLQTDLGHKDAYKEDAFGRYLAGMLYEERGEFNDAYISYWKALQAYEDYEKSYGVAAPHELAQDAFRMARRLGFTDEAAQIEKRWGASSSSRAAGDGEVVILHYNGPAPHKIDSFFEIGFVAGWAYVEQVQPADADREKFEQASAIARSVLADEVVRMAFPKYVAPSHAVRGMQVRSDALAAPAPSASVENIAAIAQKGLDDRIVRVRAKTIARAVVKFALSRRIAAKVQENRGEGAAWLTKKLLQVASAATELSDKRSWQTIPSEIRMARVLLPAGTHRLQVDFTDASGNMVSEKTLDGVKVTAGRKTFLVVRTLQ